MIIGIKNISYLVSARSESKGTLTTKELSEASALADSINKAIKVLETKNMIDEQSKYQMDYFYQKYPIILQGLIYLRTN